MNYVCLIYIDERKFDGMPRDEWDANVKEALASDEALRQSGKYVFSQALQDVARATTVRVRDGNASVTDGPFAETKEQLGGIIVIDARDNDEAVEIAKRIPMARYGSIEVRPALDVEGGELPRRLTADRRLEGRA